MSNAETSAGNTGETTATSIAEALTDLPDRIRVHALAKRLGTSSRDVLTKLAELGQTARSPQSGLDREMALQVGEVFRTGSSEGEQSRSDAEKPERAAEQTTPEPVGSSTDSDETASAGTRKSSEQPRATRGAHSPVSAAPSPVFLPPEAESAEPATPQTESVDTDTPVDKPEPAAGHDGSTEGGGNNRRRRRRGRRGRGRGKGGEDTSRGAPTDSSGEASSSPGTDHETTPSTTPEADRSGTTDGAGESSAPADEESDSDGGEQSHRRRRRRRRRKPGENNGGGTAVDDPPDTVVHVRDVKSDSKGGGATEQQDGVRSVRGSTRLEAKRQRRRDGREAGRRRAPILSEAEFLARRESVERKMVVAERGDSTQIGVLEDDVLVEHFVTSADNGSIIGNVYLGKVQNVLPSMEAAFIDIGRGRNGVLYAGEVDWDAAGLEGKARKIEQALATGDNVLVQVTKDPMGHKGARLTTQVSLPGRFLVYVPAGGPTGISRKLPENERNRLKDILKRIVPDDAGVIIRTAAEGIKEEELGRDVHRLKAQWEVIQEKAKSTSEKTKNGAPTLLYEEPDLLVKVVRDLFTEDFTSLEVQGGTAWQTVQEYVEHVAPEMGGRLVRHTGSGNVLTEHRIDEQLAKALDRKVWLPSGGYLVIDRTEAMTVIDVNTGKFTGSGGNLEETVTRNNLESAEEIVRQLRLRDIGGIIVIDFIDMVLESNRELVLRRLTECLARDRTRHQVAEVTSLGLVQMTRKRVGTGLLEAFSTTCEHCNGRGLLVSTEPTRGGGGRQQSSRRTRGRNRTEQQDSASASRSATETTSEQRESASSAVQAMANASKSAAQRNSEPREDTSKGSNGRSSDSTTSATGSHEGTRDHKKANATGTATSEGRTDSAQVPATTPAGSKSRRPRRATSRPAGPPVQGEDDES